jgi:hypothetical protein
MRPVLRQSDLAESKTCLGWLDIIGGAILNDLLAEGTREAKRVSIHVEMFNPALRLYERLGFRKLGEHGVYYFMSWSADSAA